MFTVVYTFDVKPGREEEFLEAWSFITKEFTHTRGSLGSRMHRDRDGRYVAIALWPGREVWEKPAATTNGELEAARTTMREACTSIQTAHELETVIDLWVRN